MIINIASFGGRCHLLDTARELERHGHTVRFYSYITNGRAAAFGLKKECNYSLLWFAWPYLIWMRLFGFGGWGTLLYQWLCDILLCYYMKPCDVFIGQSPMHYHALKWAKRKWGATTILERGNSHVLEYICNLSDTPEGQHFKSFAIKQDTKAYPIPDYISVGAEHVKESFLIHGIDESRLFVNNYGFDSSQFKPSKLRGNYDIIMVGTWCLRKGCDRIADACKAKGYKCLHVGPVGDYPLPDNGSITSMGTVDQQELQRYYEQAKVFVLPSREEGLALVLMQAAACGLPIVCSKESGGSDLRQYAMQPEYILELPDTDTPTLCYAIDRALEYADAQSGVRNYMGAGLHSISFEAYGNRYNDFLITVKENKIQYR